MRRSRLVNLKTLSFAALCSPLVTACVSAPPRPHAPAEATQGSTPPAAPSVVGTAAEAPSVTTASVPQAPPVQHETPPPAVRVPMQARPISGGTLKILADGRTAVAADSDRDRVYVVDLVTGHLAASVPLEPGDEPGRIVEDADGLVHVALRGGGAVATIDPVAGSLRARRALCSAPRGLAFDEDTNELHVACAGGELVTIGAPPSATTPLRSVFVERDLRDVVVAKDGRLLVSAFRSAAVYVVNGEQVSGPRSASHDVRGRAPGVAWRLVSTANGQSLMLHELSLPQALGVAQGAYGSRSNCGAVVSSTVTVVDPDSVAFPPAAPMTGALVAADVAVSPNGQQMAVVSIANDDPGSVVQFYDLGSTQVTLDTSQDGCWSPSPGPAMGDASGGDVTGDVLPAPTSFLPPNGEVVAVAYDARGNVIVQSREPATLQILTQRRDAIVLSDESRFDLGHQVFHAATSGQIACVSCHPEGGEDGRVWQFQTLGARRTQSLRGGIMDTAPFHWGGDEPNMTSLMKDVFQGRMSGAAVDAQRITALGRWLDQIPTVPVARRTDDAHVDRGAALFVSAGCAACHAGADFTNGQTVDVGTGGQFQVPQLHGMALRAPYMHDGCAATLRDRFTVGCGGSDKHANGMFTDAQVDDLVAYLETL
ncbi:MAG TPA: c-type cytochrome [Polyangia bacterium]|jgi:hypothetical protein|nr:c-type cytochrome [Polyangia bacterium]